MKRTALIVGPYRYTLERIWGEGRAFVVIGLNPSTADAEKDDATIRVLVNYAGNLGFERLLMLNLYAWRATKPADMWKASRAGYDIVGPLNNFCHLQERILAACINEKPMVFAAWGAHGQNRGNDFFRAMNRAKFELVQYPALKCFAFNKDRSPHHPLRINLGGPIHPYEISGENYG